MTTTSQTLRDYTFFKSELQPRTSTIIHRHPGLLIVIRLKVAVNSATVYEKYDYPGRYKKDEQGNPFSLYRLESELAVSETANAVGDDMRVIPGYGFTLEGHANSAFNQDWLVVRVEHSGKQTGSLDEEAGEEGNRYETHFS